MRGELGIAGGRVAGHGAGGDGRFDGAVAARARLDTRLNGDPGIMAGATAATCASPTMPDRSPSTGHQPARHHALPFHDQATRSGSLRPAPCARRHRRQRARGRRRLDGQGRLGAWRGLDRFVSGSRAWIHRRRQVLRGSKKASQYRSPACPPLAAARPGSRSTLSSTSLSCAFSE